MSVVKTGVANAPLHGGHCPRWLFEKMKQLCAAIVEIIVIEYGPEEYFGDFQTLYGFKLSAVYWALIGIPPVLLQLCVVH